MEQRILFNEEECNVLKSFLHRDDTIKTVKDARGSFNTTVSVIPPKEVPNWFLPRVQGFGVKHFDFVNKLAVSRAAIINLYGTGGYFARHRDDYALEDHWVKRYKTLVVQLSDPLSYEGGDLLVDDIPISRTIGNVAYFNASTYHELTPITKGERYSLILWLDRDDITDSKTTI